MEQLNQRDTLLEKERFIVYLLNEEKTPFSIYSHPIPHSLLSWWVGYSLSRHSNREFFSGEIEQPQKNDLKL